MNRTFLRLLPALLWMSVIFLLSHQEAGTSSALSSGLSLRLLSFFEGLGILIPKEGFHLFLRKGAHFFAYLLLGIFIAFGLEAKSIKEYGYTLLLCTLYAISDEFHQTFIPGRSGDVLDVLLDSAGALTGILLWALVKKVLKNRSQQSFSTQ